MWWSEARNLWEWSWHRPGDQWRRHWWWSRDRSRGGGDSCDERLIQLPGECWRRSWQCWLWWAEQRFHSWTHNMYKNMKITNYLPWWDSVEFYQREEVCVSESLILGVNDTHHLVEMILRVSHEDDHQPQQQSMNQEICEADEERRGPAAAPHLVSITLVCVGCNLLRMSLSGVNYKLMSNINHHSTTHIHIHHIKSNIIQIIHWQ